MSAATIRTGILDVELIGSESDGLALQQRLPAAYADVLAPALEAAFARADPGDAVLHIDRLAVEITDVPLDRLEAELAAAIGRAVDEWFRNHEPVLGTELGASASGTGVDAGAVRLRSAADTIDGALLEFLSTGRLPWWFRVPTGVGLEELVLGAWAASGAGGAPAPTARARLRTALATPQVRARLLMQFTPSFVATVVRAVAPQLSAVIDDVGRAGEVLGSVPCGPDLVRRIGDLVLRHAARGSEPSLPELARSAWREVPPAARANRVLTATVDRVWPGLAAVPDRPPGAARSTGTTGTASTTGPEGEARHHPAATPRAGDDEAAGVPPQASTAIGVPADTGEPILVDNAGVVLLHPFLPRLFEAVGIAADDELHDRHRAVALVHHLATGAVTSPEHEVTLAKVLCGWPLDDPVAADCQLTPTEREEAEALLTAAIGHWGALGNTSPDTFRAEFLMRPGSLATDGDGDWLLRVETRTADILLDQLPWGIGLLRLPWMDRLLRVEWR